MLKLSCRIMLSRAPIQSLARADPQTHPATVPRSPLLGVSISRKSCYMKHMIHREPWLACLQLLSISTCSANLLEGLKDTGANCMFWTVPCRSAAAYFFPDLANQASFRGVPTPPTPPEHVLTVIIYLREIVVPQVETVLGIIWWSKHLFLLERTSASCLCPRDGMHTCGTSATMNDLGVK